jgi:flagellar basal body rod protein FlgG
MAKEGILGDSFVKLSDEEINFSNGAIVNDGVDTHVAIKGKGFFAVESQDGETLLMRAGAFQFDNQGNLVNHMGEKVLQKSGNYVTVTQEERELQIAIDGSIFDQNGDEIGQLLILDGENLTPLNGSRWRAESTEMVGPQTEIIQGALELSNADAFREITEMIQTTRMFDTMQKAMQTSNDIDSKLNQMTRRT